MSRQPDVYIEDICEAMRKIEEYLERIPDKELGEDDMQTDAIIRNLEIIGEATKKLPEDLKQHLVIRSVRPAAVLASPAKELL